MFTHPVEETVHLSWKNRILSLFYTMISPSSQIITTLIYHVQTVKYAWCVIKQNWYWPCKRLYRWILGFCYICDMNQVSLSFWAFFFFFFYLFIKFVNTRLFLRFLPIVSCFCIFLHDASYVWKLFLCGQYCQTDNHICVPVAPMLWLFYNDYNIVIVLSLTELKVSDPSLFSLCSSWCQHLTCIH